MLNKQNLIKGGIAVAIAAFGLVSFSQSHKGVYNQQALVELRGLSKLANANADGTVTCGEASSSCTVTINGQPGQIVGKKN